MKTIFVIYTKKVITDPKELCKYKKYAFNTDSEIKVGDLIKSPDYDTPMQVILILDKSYKYYNSVSGDLSDEINSTKQWLIKDLVIRESSEANTVYGEIVNKD